MQVKSIAECSKGSTLQYFRPSFSYQLSLRPWFCLFLSGRFTHVLLYIEIPIKMRCYKGTSLIFCYRQEEMYQLLISNYEEKQQELRVENNDLRECLVHMQKELSAVLNNTDFSIMLQTRRNVPVIDLQL